MGADLIITGGRGSGGRDELFRAPIRSSASRIFLVKGRALRGAELAAQIRAPLMVLGDVAKVIVKAEEDETDVGKLALGQAAEVTADAYPGRVFPGKIIEIGQAVGERKVKPEDPAKIQGMKVIETKIEVTEGDADLFAVSADTDFGTLLATRRERVPSVILFRRAAPRAPRRQVEVLLANLPNIEPHLGEGSIVVLERTCVRIRKLPIGGS